MKAISQKTDNLWLESERALSEHTASGYKMACIEAEKVFYYKLREKGYPTSNIKLILSLFGWKLSNKDALVKALEKTGQIKTIFEYTLSSFEAEDIVSTFKDAVDDFSNARALSWQRKITIFWDNLISYRSSFMKKFLLILFLTFLTVKFLSSTIIGRQFVRLIVLISNFIFSWLLLLVGLGIVVAIVIFAVISRFEKKHSRIKEIK